MKFIVIDESQYFFDIDSASDLLGVSRRTIFEYLKKVRIEPEEKKKVGSKLYFTEDVVARMWVLQRRYGEPSVKSGNGGLTGVATGQSAATQILKEEARHGEPTT